MDTTIAMTDALERSYRLQLVVWAVLITAFSVGWVWFLFYPTPPRPSIVAFTDARYAEQTLCPGDALSYEIDVRTQPGAFVIDVSVWRLDPPSVALFSSPRRVVYSGEDESFTFRRQWVVPSYALDSVGQTPVAWSPGRYERRHAISAISRNAEPSIVVVPFRIREDCK